MVEKQLVSIAMAMVLGASGVSAAPAYDEGASDREIRIGNVSAASGPMAIYFPFRESMRLCFEKFNAEGGINGRKIKFITYDDAYSPAKTVEQTRKLVESDGVLFLVGSIGAATSIATAPYLAHKKIPHLFIGSPASKLSDAGAFPCMMGWQPAAYQEATIFARYMVDKLGAAKIGLLYQNDEFGRDFLAGLKAGLGEKVAAERLVARPYEATEPTVTSQIAQLKASGAEAVYLGGTGKFVAQGIKAIRALNWKPKIFVPYVSNSPQVVLKAAELQGDEQLYSAGFLKDPLDPTLASDPDVKEWTKWMDAHYPAGQKSEVFNVWGYAICQTAAHVIRQAGDNLTRQNILDIANSFKKYQPPMVLPGITLTSSPTQHRLVKCLQIQVWRDNRWVAEGNVSCSE